MDGRLSSGEREKVERHLEGCSRCSEELESLRYTVSLLRRMPVTSPRRTFTIAEVSPLPSTPWKARVPVWAYGAAASVVIALFALVLSADLSGSLAGEDSGPRVPDQQDAPIATAPLFGPTPAPEEAGTAEVLPPTTTPAPQPTPVPEMATIEAVPAPTPTPQAVALSVTAVPAPPTATPAAMADTPTVTAAPQATAVSVAATPSPQPTPVPEVAAMEAAPMATPTPQAVAVSREAAATADDADAPIDEQVAKEVDSSTTVSTPSPTAMPVPTPTARPTVAPTALEAPTVAGRTDSFQQTVTPVPTATSAPSPTHTPVPAPTPELLAQEVSPVEAEDGSTPIVWRVLEVVLGVAAVILVGGILWRLRYRRGRAIS